MNSNTNIFFILAIDFNSELDEDDSVFDAGGGGLIITPPKYGGPVTRHRAQEMKNHFCPNLQYSFDSDFGAKVLHVYATLPSSCIGNWKGGGSNLHMGEPCV